MRLKEAAQWIQDGIAGTLTHYSFPASHWRRRIRTNNPLELRHIAGTQWGTKRYLKMDLLRVLYLPEAHVA